MINNFEKKILWNGFETNFLIIFSQKYRYTNPTIVPVIWKYPKSNKKLATLKKMTYENKERTRKQEIIDEASQKSTELLIPSCFWINSQVDNFGSQRFDSGVSQTWRKPFDCSIWFRLELFVGSEKKFLCYEESEVELRHTSIDLFLWCSITSLFQLNNSVFSWSCWSDAAWIYVGLDHAYRESLLLQSSRTLHWAGPWSVLACQCIG